MLAVCVTSLSAFVNLYFRSHTKKDLDTKTNKLSDLRAQNTQDKHSKQMLEETIRVVTTLPRDKHNLTIICKHFFHSRFVPFARK